MIKVGMMVEIVSGGEPNEESRQTIRKYAGHIGRVIATANASKDFPEYGARYVIEGATQEDRLFPANNLRPIKGDQKLSTWSKVQEDTNWSPVTKVTA